MIYFTYSEFDSPDKPGSGKYMDKRFLTMLEAARYRAGVPFVINSGFRTPEHNATLENASPNSSHLKGVAADIKVLGNVQRFEILKACMAVGFSRIGIGRGFIHVDIDSTKSRGVIWLY